MEPATVVIDNGTGFTKMGYAGNMEPSYLFPTSIATPVNQVGRICFVLTFFILIENSSRDEKCLIIGQS